MDALCGVDAVPLLGYATKLTSHVTHFSMSFLQYGKSCRSVFLRHLLCIYAGKDTPKCMRAYLPIVMEDLKSFATGRKLSIPTSPPTEITVHLVLHLLADLVALFVQRDLESMTSSARCFRCLAGPATRINGPNADFLPPRLIDGALIFLGWEHLNMHVDFGLHFLCNWAIRILRVIEGAALNAGGDLQEAFYTTLSAPGLGSIGVGVEDTPLRVLGRHVTLLIDPNVLPSLALHPSLPPEHKLIIDSFCGLVPLVRQFRLQDAEQTQAIEHARTLAASFWSVWPNSSNLFPYFHMCDVELERELLHVHQVHKAGVGAFVCQSVESLGHFLKVAAPHTGWVADTFVRKLFELVELRWATNHELWHLWQEPIDAWVEGERNGLGDAVRVPESPTDPPSMPNPTVAPCTEVQTSTQIPGPPDTL